MERSRGKTSPGAGRVPLAAWAMVDESGHSALRARPLRAGLGIDKLTAEAVAELLCVGTLGKAEDEHVVIVASEGVRACG